MTLKEKISEDLKASMKNRDKTRVETIRMIMAGVQSFEIEKNVEASDADVLAVLRKAVRQRKDSIEEFQKGGRQDLIEKETAEIAIIDCFLPPALTEADVEAVVVKVVADLGASTMKDMGRVMKECGSRLAGAADGALVSRLVKARLSAPAPASI